MVALAYRRRLLALMTSAAPPSNEAMATGPLPAVAEPGGSAPSFTAGMAQNRRARRRLAATFLCDLARHWIIGGVVRADVHL